MPQKLERNVKKKFRGQKASFETEKNGLQAFVLFLFLLAMLSTESGLRFSGAQNWLLIKKRETF